MVDKFPFLRYTILVLGGLAQLVERLLCKQDVSGSSPLTSTKKSNNTLVVGCVRTHPTGRGSA